MNKVINYQIINKVLISLIIIFFPINYKLISIFRILDFLLIAFIFLNLKFISKKNIYFLVSILSIMIIGFLIHYFINSEIINAKKFSYVYKYLILFTFIFLLLEIKIFSINFYLKLFYIMNVLLFLWILFFNYYEITTDSYFYTHDFSFPFTFIHSWRGDKHLLAATLFSLNTLLFYNYFVRGKIILCTTTFIILLIETYLLNSTSLHILTPLIVLYMIFKNHLSNINLLSICFIIFFITLLLISINSEYGFIKKLYIYTINIDQNLLDKVRVQNILELLTKKTFITFLFGGGYLYNPSFVDNGVITLIDSFGLFFIFLYLILYRVKIGIFFQNLNKDLFVILIFIIFINLFITEFFLIFRYIIPTVLLFYLSFITDNLNKE